MLAARSRPGKLTAQSLLSVLLAQALAPTIFHLLSLVSPPELHTLLRSITL